VTERWATPRARNEFTLEQIRNDLLSLRFEIPREVIADVPDCQLARDLMEKLCQLQRRVELVTSRDGIHRSLYPRRRNIDNRTRGRWGEFAARVYLQTSLLIPYDSIELDQITFETPYGGRRIDCFVKEKRLALEVKSAYVDARRRNREQIQKDAYLLAKGGVRTVTWILLGGGSRRIRQLLAEAKVVVETATESCLRPVLNLFHLITLSSASQEEVLAVMDKIFAVGLESLISKQRASSTHPGVNGRVDS
jgi:hypothetical protein